MARVELFARTDVGCTRERNEDAFISAHLGLRERGLSERVRLQDLAAASALIGVCDGMGGAAAGDLAAQMASEQLLGTMQNAAPYNGQQALDGALLTAVQNANRAIAEHARQHPDKAGMGSTMTALYVGGGAVTIGHLGDSRAYLRRGRVLQQLTTDHSVVGQMLATGQLTPEQARSYEHRNVLLQALGVQPTCTPEIVHVQVRSGDTILLCTDGLDGHLTDPQILDVMLRQEDPVRCCRALTEAACRAGGHDNVTVAVLRFVGEGLALPRPGEAIGVDRQTYQVT